MYEIIFNLQAEVLKAMAHPRRLEIINLLRDQELSVTDMFTMLDLPQANISQHLMILRDAKIVETRRDGKQIMYNLSDPRISEACDLFRELLIDQHRGTDVASALHLHMKELVPVVHDPVCQMRLSPKTASYSTDYQGHHYFFCASGCLKSFTKNPEAYVQT